MSSENRKRGKREYQRKYRARQLANWQPLSLERLCGLLEYDPEAGILRWKTGRRFGEEAGRNQKGYRKVKIDGKDYFSHRLGWALYHGQWPRQLDHKNGNPSDNRIINLREADGSGNGANRGAIRDGLKGACFNKRAKRWYTQIQKNGEKPYLGYFGTEQEAHEAYCTAALELHGEFARFA